MPTLIDATPVIAVSEIDHAVAFFHDSLGFTVGHRFPGFAYLHRDSATLRLIGASDGVTMEEPARQQGIYIDVSGIDALYAELEPVLESLPNIDVRPPFDQPYGQREFHVYYEALQIIFGAPIPGKDMA